MASVVTEYVLNYLRNVFQKKKKHEFNNIHTYMNMHETHKITDDIIKGFQGTEK